MKYTSVNRINNRVFHIKRNSSVQSNYPEVYVLTALDKALINLYDVSEKKILNIFNIVFLII